MHNALTVTQVQGLPVTVDVPTAGRAFGISSSLARELVREGKFPVHVIRLGRRQVVRRIDLLNELGIKDSIETAQAV